MAAGNGAAAAEIYDEVRESEVPTQRRIEATRGAILARQDDGIPLLMELFRSPDPRMFRLALTTAREFPGGQVDAALADELRRAVPERGTWIVQAMADRPDTVIVPAIVQA